VRLKAARLHGSRDVALLAGAGERIAHFHENPSYSLNQPCQQLDQVHSEVMVDQASGVEHFKKKLYKWNLKLGGGILFNPTQSDSRETFDPLLEKQDNSWVTDVFDDSKFEMDRRNDFLQSSELLNFQFLGGESAPDERLMLLPPRLYGYS